LDALGQEREHLAVVAGNAARDFLQVLLGGPDRGGAVLPEGHLDLAVLDAPGVLAQLRPADVLGDRPHRRVFLQPVRDALASDAPGMPRRWRTKWLSRSSGRKAPPNCVSAAAAPISSTSIAAKPPSQT